MPLHLAPNFLSRLKLCIWNRTSRAGFSGQAAHTFPPRCCQELGFRLRKVSLYIPAAAICPGVLMPFSFLHPLPLSVGMRSQAPGPALGGVIRALQGSNTFYCRRQDPGVGKREKDLDKSVLVPAKHRPGESRQSFLALHQESPGFSQHPGPFRLAAFLASPQGKKKEEKKKKRKKMAKSALCSAHIASTSASAAPQP